MVLWSLRDMRDIGLYLLFSARRGIYSNIAQEEEDEHERVEHMPQVSISMFLWSKSKCFCDGFFHLEHKNNL